MTESEAEQALSEEIRNADTTPAQSEKEELAQALAGLGRRPLVMPLIIAANIAMFVLMVGAGVSLISPSTMDIIKWGGNLGGLTLNGEWWRLGSSMFIHIGIIHIAMNMVVLWDAGRVVERLVGRLGFFSMYVVSGLLGSVASLVWNEGIVSAGASGAVFGVFGCMFALLLRDHGLLPKSARTRLAKSAGLFIGYNILFGASVEGIDMAAHAGGLAAGFVCGLLLALPLGGRGAEGQRLRAGVVGIVGVGAVVLALTVLLGPVERPVLIDPGAVLKFDSNAIYYTDGATREDAKRVKTVLIGSEYFAKGREAAVRISKEGESFVVGLVVMEHAANNPEFEGGFLSLGAMLSVQAFDGTSVVIELLDGNLAKLQRLEPVDVDTVMERGTQPEFLAGLNFEALRSSPLYKRHETELETRIGEALTEMEFPVACQWTLLSSLRSIVVRHYREDPEAYLVVIRGLTRETLGNCIMALDSTGEELSLSTRGDDSALFFSGITLALHWLDADSFIFELDNAGGAPVPVVDPAKLASRLTENVAYDGNAVLLESVGKINASAAVWLALVDPVGHMEIVVDEGVAISGRSNMGSLAASSFVLDSFKAAARDVIELPSVSAFLAEFSFENQDGQIKFDAAFDEARLWLQLQAFASDDAFTQLFAD